MENLPETKIIPKEQLQWLYQRGIDERTIDTNGLSWDGQRIVIPVFSPTGEFLFNKYRRDPLVINAGPKYTYQPGTTAQLYNAQKLGTKHSVIICEGELDALALESRGYLAVSSTGGAATFKDEWVELLAGKDVYVCFDNDAPGLVGAVKVLAKLPGKLVMIPKMSVFNQPVKDVTEYLQTGNSFPLLLDAAEEFPILSDPLPPMRLVRDYETQIKKYTGADLALGEKERAAFNNDNFHWHYKVVRETLNQKKEELQDELKKFRRSKRPAGRQSDFFSEEEVQQAKDVPIDTMLRFNNQKRTRCLWHEDHNPSLYWYKNNNVVKCFSCGVREDSIGTCRKLFNLTFDEAVRKLIC